MPQQLAFPRPAPIFAHTLRSKADACSRHPPDPQPQASPIPAPAPIPPQVREALLRPPENRIKPTCRRYPSVEPCQLRKRAPYRRIRIGTAAGGDPCLPLAWPPWLGNLLGAIPALEYGGASACLHRVAEPEVPGSGLARRS